MFPRAGNALSDKSVLIQLSKSLFRLNKIIFAEKISSDDRNSPSPIMKRTNSAEYRDVEIREIYLRRSKVTGNP